MSCKNHPNAKAIAQCQRCKDSLCGMCAKYLKHGVFCENCEILEEAKQFVSNRTQQVKRQEQGKQALDSKIQRKPADAADKPQGRNYRQLIGVAMLLLTSAALYVYANPGIFEFDAEKRASLQARDALESCRLVFEEIGEILEAGGNPDPSLHCADVNTVNIVSREGGIVRVAHPNPAFYQLKEFYVTSESHEAIMVE